jgi:hypothetical protein
MQQLLYESSKSLKRILFGAEGVIDILAVHFMLQSIYLYYSCVGEQGDPWASKVSSTEGNLEATRDSFFSV